jgi:hypothetical protein
MSENQNLFLSILENDNYQKLIEIFSGLYSLDADLHVLASVSSTNFRINIERVFGYLNAGISDLIANREPLTLDFLATLENHLLNLSDCFYVSQGNFAMKVYMKLNLILGRLERIKDDLFTGID